MASGGELSRLMLSIKSLLSDSLELPTIIFDEVDSGVSGEIAEKVGAIMKKMSQRNTGHQYYTSSPGSRERRFPLPGP